MTPDEFRRAVPALERWAWLDTPGSAPAAAPVASALRRAIDDQLSGEFDWTEWDAAADRARAAFAAWFGVPEQTVATVGSLAEAAATVARFRRPGRALLAADEFQSLLLPFVAEAARSARRPVELVEPVPGRSRSDGLLDRIRPGVSLVAVSEATTLDGERIDLAALRSRSDEVGAELFVNGTQSLGALRPPSHDVAPDFYAVHGYKWMLAPRGAAWLVATAESGERLASIAPGWKTAAGSEGLFGGRPLRTRSLARCDTSQAWLPWIGAEAAIGLLSALDAGAVEARAVGLADRFEECARALGAIPVRSGPGSHIRVVEVADPRGLDADLAEADVRARVTGNRLRVGVHGFNDESDIERVVAVLARRANRR